jgi:HTH-type transcriptional regulator/antitoxin MqsA
MNTNSARCPVCGEGELSPQTFSEVFTINGQKIVVHDLEGSLCGECGADPILQPQILRNQALIADAKRAHLGLLKADEIKLIREALGLTQKQAADKFGGGPNAFSKYERGEVIQSEPMDKLLRAAYFAPQTLNYLNRRVAAEPIHTVFQEYVHGSIAAQASINAAFAGTYFIYSAGDAVQALLSRSEFSCVVQEQEFETATSDWSTFAELLANDCQNPIFSKPFKRISDADGWENAA